jgi:prophage antirepressor-like protein
MCSTDTPGGPQEVVIVSESGLYTLILRSRTATTPGTVQHRFRRWVTSEVLPAIRKTGTYVGAESRVASAIDQECPYTVREAIVRPDGQVCRRGGCNHPLF